MIGTIRRHQKWLWAIIITVTIISFVVFFSPTSRMGSGRSHAQYGTLNGHSIRREEYLDAYHEAQLRYFFSNHEWPEEDTKGRQRGLDMNRETRSRLFLVGKLKEFKIDVGDDVVAQRIQEVFQDRETHVFRKEGYDRFITERLNPKGITREDLLRFLRHEVGVQELVAVIGLPGRLVSTNEALTLFQSENEELATQAAIFSASNYLARVTPDPRAIGEFYTNRQALYRLPNRVQVSYVKFAATNFLTQADQRMADDTNLTFKVENYYLQQGTNTFKDAANNILPPEAAKQKIRSDIRREYALMEARRKANEFATELFDMLPARAENLAALAAKHQLRVEETAPFSPRESPPNLNVPEQFTKVAFNLTEVEPFGPPIVAEDGVYVVALQKRVPSELPPLETIRDQVTTGYLNYQASIMARAAGSNFVARATNDLGAGKKFEAIGQEAGVPVETFPPFSLATRSLPQIEQHVNLNDLKAVAVSLRPGEISPFVPTREGGFVLQLKGRLPVSADKIKTDFPDFVRELRLTRQYQVFNDWFRREADKAKVIPPENSASPLE